MQKRQSDLKLLDSLYCEHHQLVYKLISNRLYRGLGTKADADDLMQEVFIIAGDHISTLRKHPNQVGWLMQTAHNVVRNHIRTKARHKEQLFHSLDLHRSNEDFDAIDFDATLQNVLNPDDYAILRAYYFDNRPHDEICTKHGLSEAALRVRISRIKKLLKNYFILVVTFFLRQYI